MEAHARNIVILPYYCDAEVARYLKIAERLRSFPEPAGGYHFLLASSPKTRPSYQLQAAFSQIGNTIPFACPTQIFGYPEGPTAMFWDCMDYLATHYGGQPGFGLWMESDMAPTKADWIDRLSREWSGPPEQQVRLGNSDTLTLNDQAEKSKSPGVTTPIMMGCYVPRVFKHRIFKGKKLLLHAHINGGACYAMDFAKHMPREARKGVFDMSVFEYASSLGRIRSSPQIAFSTLTRVRRDLQDNSKVLLHGFMQDKDRFIEECCRPLTEAELRKAVWHPWIEQWETLQRKIRVQFVRRGQQAMLENMFLAKKDFDQNQAKSSPALERKTA
jgi:hypothetical protein